MKKILTTISILGGVLFCLNVHADCKLLTMDIKAAQEHIDRETKNPGSKTKMVNTYPNILKSEYDVQQGFIENKRNALKRSQDQFDKECK
ncbi:MAG: hypothetical protein Q8L85_05280 [Alphaproteobacteria bacterium]|nr:hypothetical protein [Alphaproteobacteria bacterium]